MNKRVLWIIVGILALLAVSCAVCFGTGIVGLFAISRPPEAVDINVRYPEQVAKDEPFTIDILVRDLSGRERTLDSIDIDEALLEGVVLMRAQPRVKDILPNTAGFTSYFFERPIPPNGELPVRLHMQALKPGLYQGTVDVCIDGPTRCASYELTITVTP